MKKNKARTIGSGALKLSLICLMLFLYRKEIGINLDILNIVLIISVVLLAGVGICLRHYEVDKHLKDLQNFLNGNN